MKDFISLKAIALVWVIYNHSGFAADKAYEGMYNFFLFDSN